MYRVLGVDVVDQDILHHAAECLQCSLFVRQVRHQVLGNVAKRAHRSLALLPPRVLVELAELTKVNKFCKHTGSQAPRGKLVKRSWRLKAVQWFKYNV